MTQRRKRYDKQFKIAAAKTLRAARCATGSTLRSKDTTLRQVPSTAFPGKPVLREARAIRRENEMAFLRGRVPQSARAAPSGRCEILGLTPSRCARGAGASGSSSCTRAATPEGASARAAAAEAARESKRRNLVNRMFGVDAEAAWTARSCELGLRPKARDGRSPRGTRRASRPPRTPRPMPSTRPEHSSAARRLAQSMSRPGNPCPTTLKRRSRRSSSSTSTWQRMHSANARA